MKRILFLLVLVVSFVSANAQYFQTGQDPASIHWRQINTKNFQLIYPDYYELQAQKLAYVLEKVYNYGSYTLHYSPKKISVILHTQTVKSNGLVAWAPKRAEFYTTPHQDIYPQDWLQQLALHEFRHVVQVDKINSEVPELIKVIFGQQGTALIFGAYLPWWFIEGDAVVTETALSHYGRGRFPSFLMEHKAQVIEKGVYSYDKAYNGSIKNYVPDHYQLGYYLVGNTDVRYGSQVWDSVLTRVGRHPLSFTPFNTALKRETGFKKVQLYFSIFDSLKNVWQAADEEYHSVAFKKLSPENRRYSSYTYNHWLNDSTLLAYKTSLDEIPSFVTIDSKGNERKIFHPGSIFNESVGYRDNFIVWSEHIPNPRWTHSGKSLIRILNIHTKQITEIKPEFKCFSPSISPDKKKVAVVEADFSSNYFISVYSIPEGKLLKRIQTPDNNYMFSPEWINNKELALVILYQDGKRLEKLNLQDEKFNVLIDRNLGDIKQLRVAGTKIYFVSSYSAKNALYAYDLNSGKINHLYEPRFDVEYPAVNAETDKIALSDYTADGFRSIAINKNDIEQIPLDKVKKGNYRLANALSKQEPGIPDFTYPENAKKYPSKKYSKVAHLFHFHSWAPAFVDVNKYKIGPGLSLMSQNKLGTAETILGYKWDVAGRTGKFYARYSFKGWYPIIDAEINTGKQASEYLLINQTKNDAGEIIRQDTSLERYTWNATSANLNVRVPLLLNKGAFNRALQPEVQYDFTYYTHDSSTPEHFFQGNFQSLTYRLYFHQLLRQSSQDVYPNFGIALDAMYRSSPFGTTRLGNLTAFQSSLYLPGLMKNHGIRLYSGVQKKNITGSFGFSESIRYPRGWGKINTTEMYTLTADYKLPLFYPEWNLAGLVYIQRIKASFFADYAHLKGNVYKEGKVVGRFDKQISSTGVELTGDVNFLRFYAPVNMGIRASYLPELQSVYTEFLFSIDLASL